MIGPICSTILSDANLWQDGGSFLVLEIHQASSDTFVDGMGELYEFFSDKKL